MKKAVMVIGWLCGIFLAQSPILFAQSKADCLACHSDSSLSGERGGKQVSLFVDEHALAGSPHKKLVCVACHAGFKADDIPHKENIEPLNCLKCHTNAPLKHTFHPQLAEAIRSHQEPDVS